MHGIWSAIGYNLFAVVVVPLLAYWWLRWLRRRRLAAGPAPLAAAWLGWLLLASIVVFWIVRNLPIGAALAPRGRPPSRCSSVCEHRGDAGRSLTNVPIGSARHTQQWKEGTMTHPSRRGRKPMPEGVPLPIEVRRAALGVYIVSVCYLLLGMIAILTRDAALTIARETETNLTDTQIVAAVNGVVLIEVVLGFGVAAGGIVSAIHLIRGRRWARVSATIAVSIALLFSVVLGMLGSGAVAVAMHALVIISGAAALYFLFRRSSSAFFARPLVR